jgi:hypothetical protein
MRYSCWIGQFILIYSSVIPGFIFFYGRIETDSLYFCEELVLSEL